MLLIVLRLQFDVAEREREREKERERGRERELINSQALVIDNSKNVVYLDPANS